MGSLVRAIFYFTSFLPNLLDAASPKTNNGEQDINGKTFDYVRVPVYEHHVGQYTDISALFDRSLLVADLQGLSSLVD
jgi:hypothetical protein